jgi:uncharacterized membrane protein HdeD (DUF308 family)
MDVYNLKEMWGAVALRGMLSILFGIAAVFWPEITLVTLVYLFATYVLVNGLVNEIIGLINYGGTGNTFWGRLLLILLGLAEIGVGVYLLRHPLVSFATLILIIGLMLIVRGLFEAFVGIFGEGTPTFKAILIVSGILATLAGVIMLFQPVAGGVAFVWVLGLYALITGPMLLALAFEAKNSVVEVSRPVRKSRAAR